MSDRPQRPASFWVVILLGVGYKGQSAPARRGCWLI